MSVRTIRISTYCVFFQKCIRRFCIPLVYHDASKTVNERGRTRGSRSLTNEWRLQNAWSSSKTRSSNATRWQVKGRSYGNTVICSPEDQNFAQGTLTIWQGMAQGAAKPSRWIHSASHDEYHPQFETITHLLSCFPYQMAIEFATSRVWWFLSFYFCAFSLRFLLALWVNV